MSVSNPPPSSVPTPPKHSNAPFIGAAVAMLAAIGGLIFWKLSAAPPKEERPIASAAPPAVELPPPTLEQPPPPPPPSIEPEDAGPAANNVPAKKAAAAAGAGGCAGECTGTPAPTFQNQLRGVAGLALACYNRALQSNDQLGGRMLVNLRVGPNGQVCSANVASNQVGDPALSSCVLQKFRGAQFAAPKNGCVEAQVPLNFVAKK